MGNLNVTFCQLSFCQELWASCWGITSCNKPLVKRAESWQRRFWMESKMLWKMILQICHGWMMLLERELLSNCPKLATWLEVPPIQRITRYTALDFFLLVTLLLQSVHVHPKDFCNNVMQGNAFAIGFQLSQVSVRIELILWIFRLKSLLINSNGEWLPQL